MKNVFIFMSLVGSHLDSILHVESIYERIPHNNNKEKNQNTFQRQRRSLVKYLINWNGMGEMSWYRNKNLINKLI